MRRLAALWLVLLFGACAKEQRQPQMVPEDVQEAPAPVLLRYLPPERGGPEAYPEAQVSAVLDLSGPCVGLQGHGGEQRTVVSSPGPHVGRDAAGPYVEASGERLRHGSSVGGGGGWFSHVPELGALERPVPDACRSTGFVVVTGMERYDPADEPPPTSPPPPPIG